MKTELLLDWLRVCGGGYRPPPPRSNLFSPASADLRVQTRARIATARGVGS